MSNELLNASALKKMKFINNIHIHLLSILVNSYQFTNNRQKLFTEYDKSFELLPRIKEKIRSSELMHYVWRILCDWRKKCELLSPHIDNSLENSSFSVMILCNYR